MSKKEDITLAQALYGKKDKSPEKPDLSALKPFWDTSDKPEPEANTKPSLTDALYGNPTQRMENTLGRTLDQNISEIRDHLALTNDQAQAMRKKHVQWFTDIVLTGDAESVHTLLASRTLKPATEEEQTAWVSQTMKEVRQRFGDNADRLLAKARKLIDARPELGEAIAAAGIGNHRDFVLAVVERVRHEETQGRL